MTNLHDSSAPSSTCTYYRTAHTDRSAHCSAQMSAPTTHDVGRTSPDTCRNDMSHHDRPARVPTQCAAANSSRSVQLFRNIRTCMACVRLSPSAD